MNREILFRGKDKYDDKWVYGLPSRDDNGEIVDIEIYTGPYYGTEYIGVNPDTIGQYTGLKDEKSAKVFEGDFFLYEDCYCIVIYDEKQFKWVVGITDERITVINENTPVDCYEPLEEFQSGLRIIGNIYDSEVSNG